MSVNKIKKTLTVIGIAITVLAVGCGGGRDEVGDEQVDIIILPVKATVAVKRDVVRSLNFSGNIDAHKRAAIAPAAAAAGSRIQRIYVEEGHVVTIGQILVRLEDYQLKQTEVQLMQLEADFSRMEALYAKKSIPAQQYELAATALTNAKAGYEMLKSSIELRAPFSGTVIGRYANEGELYLGKPGYDGTVGILSIAQLDKMEIEVMVAEQEFVHLKYGQLAKITLDAFPGRTFEGEITVINPSINRKSRTANITIGITDPNKELRPGMLAKVEIAIETRPNVLAVPLSAIIGRDFTVDNREAYVFTVDNNETPFNTKAKPMLVKLGLITLKYVEILAGIAEQTVVLVDNHVYLTEETEISVTEIFNKK